MTPKEVIAISLEQGQDPIEYLHDYMVEKDSPVSRKWCRWMVEKYRGEEKEKLCLTNSVKTTTSAP
jgi:hypothetical protein